MSSGGAAGLRGMSQPPPRPKTFVLIPGAGGDPWYWHRVVPLLEARGHVALPVALPAADPSADLDDYLAEALRAVGDRDELTVVGQSMGALTAARLCRNVDARALVLVCPMILRPGELPDGWWAMQEVAQRELDVAEGRDPDAPFDVLVRLMHDLPQEVLDAVFARPEPRQSMRPFEAPFALDAWPRVPTRVIAGARDRLFPAPFVERLARERLGVSAELVDTGHLPAFAAPEALTDLLVSGGQGRV